MKTPNLARVVLARALITTRHECIIVLNDATASVSVSNVTIQFCPDCCPVNSIVHYSRVSRLNSYSRA